MIDEPMTAMNHYRLLGRSGLRVSPLCLGTMTFGTDWAWGADREASKSIFDAYVQSGGNFIDTANFYTDGTSERYLGEFMGAERERYVLGTKYTLCMRKGDPNAGGNHRKNMARSLEASLKRLKTDYVDVYWVHAWDGTTPVDEMMRGLDDLVRVGKVLYVAISDTPAWKVAQLNTYAEVHGLTRFIATQVSYSLAMREVEREIVPMSRALGLGVMPWSPLAAGVLTGKYTHEDLQTQNESTADEVRNGGPSDPFKRERRTVLLTEKRLEIAGVVRSVADEIGRTPSQVAINWLLTRPGVTSVILGARTEAQIQDNLGCLEFTLPEEVVGRLDAISAIDMGFPHDFLTKEFVRGLMTGGAEIEGFGGLG